MILDTEQVLTVLWPFIFETCKACGFHQKSIKYIHTYIYTHITDKMLELESMAFFQRNLNY